MKKLIETSFLKELGLKDFNAGTSSGCSFSNDSGTFLDSFSPVDGVLLGKVSITSETEYQAIMEKASRAFVAWRSMPAPKRGEVVRQYGDVLRKHKDALGKLVSAEMGKSLQEGFGEVQEMIDICDFALGLSRQLYGLTMHSERPGHRMYEQWHPLGIVGVISAFNFPVAVWSWNAMIALVCGNVVVWKPSEKTPLCAVACHLLLEHVLRENSVPEGVCNLITGNYQVGEWLSADERIPLISATGSTAMGKKVAMKMAARLGKTILELGGNNAIIVTPSADLNLVLTGALFGAVGTAGQRCTSTRRLIVHESLFEEVQEKLKRAYAQLRIGNPLDSQYHVGPLIDKDAVEKYLETLQQIPLQGGALLVEGGVLTGEQYESGCYVKPCVALVHPEMDIVKKETFAPILYLMPYKTIEEAIAIQNGVPQGLSSAIMTNDLRESEFFLSANGSDCGIANVNIGTSGAEIGGAFGGEKETGGGRESGSDSWKAYMRRQTNTINYGKTLPLAQGIQFDL
jgi:aldehyde dehydrogenase (NAD+)